MPLDLEDDGILGSLLEGRWRLVRRIGRGGMGQVFQVIHSKMGIVRCVKILRPGADEILVQRFEREVQLAQQIRHPNVIRIDDFGIDKDLAPEGLLYYVMEFIEGKSLRELLSRGELPVGRTARLIQQVARGVAAAHVRNIIHRDIKPENFVISGDDHLTVLDFGIAKLRAPEHEEGPHMETLTRRGEIWATPQYMSPEQAMASADLTTKTDVYSLGCVLFECLTGDLPFPGETPKEFIVAHVQKDPPSIRKRRPELDLPEGLDSLVTAMLQKKPAKRPESMEAVADALAAYARGEDAPAPPWPSTAGDSPPRRAAEPTSTPAAPSKAAPAKGGRRGAEPPAPPPRAAAKTAPRIVAVPHGPLGEDGLPLPRAKPFPPRAKVFVNLGEELHEHILGRSRVTIGRLPKCDIFIPDTLASKAHAEIVEVDGRYYAVDLDSRNGTYLGKKRISGRVTLGERELLRIGNTLLLFVRGNADALDHFSFCSEGHPSDRDAKFCGSCGRPI